MSKYLRDLQFQTLRDFLACYGFKVLPSIVDRVHIKKDKVPVITSFTGTLNGIELVAKAIRILLLDNPENHLCTGYVKHPSGTLGCSKRMVCYAPNTSSNIFKSHEWACLIKTIGDELTLFLLTKCSIVQVVNGTCVFLAGNFRALYETPMEKMKNCINREVIFHRQSRKVHFCSLDAFAYIFGFCKEHKYKTIRNDVKDALGDVEKRWGKLCLVSTFKSYFKNELIIENKELLECDVEPRRIVDFLFLVSKKLFKNVFFLHEFRILKSKISLLMHRNRHETISKNELLKRFRISWFKFFRYRRCSGHEFVFRSVVASRFLMYIFNNLFVKILSKLFYSTETSFSKFKVYYFPRYSWGHFSNAFITTFLKGFDKLKNEDVRLYSEMRCIPKKNGARMVLNMSKSYGKTPSINRRIYPEFCVLRDETKERLGNSVLGYSDIYKKLTPYLSMSKDRLYILKLDVSGCFDSIPQDVITGLVRGALGDDKYHIKTFSVLEKAYGEVRCRRMYKVIKGIWPVDTFTRDPGSSDNKIVKEGCVLKVLTREEIESNITNLVRKNVVRYCGDFFVQRKGIAQGSVLSTLLCNLYYGYMDDMCFDKIFKKGILVRYVDDFLIVTPSMDEIVDFVNISKSLSDICFNKSKIISNFGIEERSVFGTGNACLTRDSIPTTNKPVIWCGCKIYPKGFSVKANLAGPYFRFSVAHNSVRPGKALLSKMKTLLRNRTPAIYINSANLRKYENIYDAFLVYGRKLKLFLQRLDFVNNLFLDKILKYSKELVYRICKKRNISLTRKKIEAISSNAFRRSGVYPAEGMGGS